MNGYATVKIVIIAWTIPNTQTVASALREGERMKEDRAISLNAVLDICGCSEVDFWSEEMHKRIKELPSVTPQPKTGHWIEKDGFDGDTYYDCSECGESWTTIEGTPWDNQYNYCPNCGAKMD